VKDKLVPVRERGIVAPYIVMWSAEQDLPFTVVERRGFGIAYADEILADRDDHGVLRRRTSSGRRMGDRSSAWFTACDSGGPCGGCCAGMWRSADQTDDGVLWLLPDHRVDWAGWPSGMAAVEPPVCLPCVDLSASLCPALRKGSVVIRVRDFPVAGVRGALYQRGAVSPVATREAIVTFDDPAIRWVRATHLVRELRGCTIIPWKELPSTVNRRNNGNKVRKI